MAFTAKIADIIADDKTGLLSKHESWERITLSDVVEILNGAPFDSAHFNPTTGTALARIRDVLSGESTTYYSGAYEEIHVLKQGDLLVGMDGDFHTGFWGTQPALLNQRVCKLTPDEAFYDKALLGYVLPGYLAAINAHTPSITVKHLSSKTIGEIELPVPPRAEQTRIVEKLESLLADLDAGVAELKAAQRKLAQYRQSLLKAAVEGALTADWRGNTPAAGELPNGWVWKPLGELLVRIEAGKSFKCEERRPTKEEIGVVKVSAVTWGEYDEAESKTCRDENLVNQSLFVSKGDFLFSRANTIDLVGACVIAEHVTQHIMLSDKILRFVFVEPTLAPWILIVLRSQHGRKQIESLASGNQESMRNIGQERIKQIAVPFPPLAEQHAILAHLETALAACKEQEHAIAHGLKLAAAQRQNLLRAAFSGQLVPQDENDEPASELLARIRARRAEKPGAKKRGRQKA